MLDEAVNGQEAVAKTKELSPDLILMDVDMPKLNGHSKPLRIIRKEYPEKSRVLDSFRCTPRDKAVVLQIIQSGAQGYVLKRSAPPVADLY